MRILVSLIGIALAVWLAAMDRVARGWDRTFVALVMVPVALSLTNGHLFTTLLSFGGLFWMVMLYVSRLAVRPASIEGRHGHGVTSRPSFSS